MSNKIYLTAFSADISVTFDNYPPFRGKVYVAGDGNHAVFDWPAQENTEKTFELAQFRTQTKWVTNDQGCTKSGFTDPDPKFVGMVSHEGYEFVSNNKTQNVYSNSGITCTYDIDEEGREVISSIVFQGAKIEFSNAVIAPQNPDLFEPPCDCKDSN